MKLSECPEKIKPFVFHGLHLEPMEKGEVKEVRGDCPFCDKSNHFFVKAETGQWQCKRCSNSGNIYSFLQMLLNESLPLTTDDDYESLSEDRHVPVWVLKEFRVCRSMLNGEWLLPTFNEKNAISNLYKYTELTDPESGETITKLLSTPTCKIGLFGTPLLTDKQKQLCICEGPWDGMALYGVLGTLKKKGDRYVTCKNGTPGVLLEAHGVLCVPGAGTFQESWLNYFPGRNVDLLFDNDHPLKKPDGGIRLVKGQCVRPGWDGMTRVVAMVNQTGKRPRRLRVLAWGQPPDDVEQSGGYDGVSSPKNLAGYGHNNDLPHGYDIRDLIKDKGPREVVSFLKSAPTKIEMEKPSSDSHTDIPTVEPIERTTFEDLCKDYASVLHFSPQLRDTLCVMLSVITSTDLLGDQLWLKVIGPPGSGKTTLAEAVSVAREYCMPKSVLTGFHSGYLEQDGRRASKDNSLIPDMKGKTVIVKDADTLIQAPNRDKIMSELRDIYDGTSRSHYRTGKQNDYSDIRTTFILCGTDELRMLNRSFLGERFLDCEIMTKDQDTTPYLQRAMSNTYSKITQGMLANTPDNDDNEVREDSSEGLFLQQVTYGFLKHLKESLPQLRPPILPKEVEGTLGALATFLAYMRARVRRDGYDLAYRPRAELPTRIASQLVKLAVCIAIVLGKETIDDEVLRIVRDRVLDTSVGFQLDVAKALIDKEEGLSVRQICVAVNLPETNVRRLLNDLQEFNIVERYQKSNKSGQRGRDMHLWVLTEGLSEIYKAAFLDQKPVQKSKPKPKPKARKK